MLSPSLAPQWAKVITWGPGRTQLVRCDSPKAKDAGNRALFPGEGGRATGRAVCLDPGKEGVSGAGGLTGTEAKALERGGCLPTCGGEPMVSGEGCGGAFSSQEAPTLK